MAFKRKHIPVKGRPKSLLIPRTSDGTESQSGRLVQGTPLYNDGSTATVRKQNLIICAVLAMVTLCIYFPVFSYPFLNYDDDIYVTKNSFLNTGLNWRSFEWAWTATATGNWHPMTWISHAFDCQLFGMYAGGHHFHNLALHVLNAVLLFLLLNRVTGWRWRSAIVAALFAFHPLNVESVAWVAERKNLLCAFFFWLTLGAYGWYARNPQIKRYLCVAVLFALGLASKPMIVTLPFVLLLVDFWPLGRIKGWSAPSTVFPVSQRQFSRLMLEKLPLLALSGGSCVATIIAQRSAHTIGSLTGWSAKWRVENAIHSYAEYLRKIFFPSELAVFYPGMVLRAWKVELALAFLIVLGWMTYWQRSRRSYIVVGVLWFLGMLVPVIGIVQVGSQSMADRYTYLPAVGIFVAVVWVVAEAAKSVGLDRRLLASGVVVVLATLCLLAARQVRFWKSSYDLWSHTLQVTVNNFVAEENLGQSLVAMGQYDEALPHFLNAEMIDGGDPTAQSNLGSALLRRGRYSEAIEHFDAVTRLTNDPSYLVDAYKGMGVASAQLGDRAKARDYFLQTLRFNSQDPTNVYNLSLLEVEVGIDKMAHSLSVHPTAPGYLQLAQLLQEDHKISDAQDAYQKALQLDPSLEEAKQALIRLKSDPK